MKAWIAARLNRDARIVHKLWSVRIALAWAAVAGIWVALPAFQGYVRPVPLMCASIIVSMLICVARITKQPGLPDV